MDGVALVYRKLRQQAIRRRDDRLLCDIGHRFSSGSIHVARDGGGGVCHNKIPPVAVCDSISSMQRNIRYRLNGRPVSMDTDDQRLLLWVLRGDLELTGTKYGCGLGICGACTVAVDGQAMRSCQTRLGDVQGKNVVTIEGLERDGKARKS